MRFVVLAEREGGTPVVAERPQTNDGLALAIDVLIDHRRRQHDFTGAGRKDQLPGVAEVHGVSTVERQHEPRRIGARSNDEIELELLLDAVVDQIDAWVDVLVRNSRKRRHVGAPRRLIAPVQVVDAPRRCFKTRDTGGFLCTEQGHT